MRRLILSMLVLAASTAACWGQVKCVPCDPKDGIQGSPLFAVEQMFTHAGPNCGTVNKHAVVTAFACQGSGGTTMAIKAAIDSNSPDANTPNVLRLDFTGEGKFDNRNVIPLPEITENSGCAFGPQTLHVERGGKTIPVRVSGMYYRGKGPNGEDYRQLQLYLGAALEGNVAFGDKTCKVRLIDGTSNLVFTDAAQPIVQNGQAVWFGSGDTVAVDTGDGTFSKDASKAFYGQPILVGDKWYDVKLSGDQASITAAALDVPTGSIKINQPSWSCKLAGKKHLLVLTGNQEPQAIPVDDYVMLEYSLPASGKADHSQPMLMATGGQDANGRLKTIHLEAGKTVEIPVGGPLNGRAVATTAGEGQWRINMELTDVNGGHIRSLALAGGKTPDPPKVAIAAADGKKVGEVTLEYG